METVWSNTDREWGYFSSDERKYITMIRKLKKQHPDLVTILAEPETNDGCIYARLPAEWLKISPKRTCNMSDEQKAVGAERLRKLREAARERQEPEQPDEEDDEA